jgi:hypothetical protein
VLCFRRHSGCRHGLSVVGETLVVIWRRRIPFGYRYCLSSIRDKDILKVFLILE